MQAQLLHYVQSEEGSSQLEGWLESSPFFFLLPVLGSARDFATAQDEWLAVKSNCSCGELEELLDESSQCLLALENSPQTCPKEFLDEFMQAARDAFQAHPEWSQIGWTAQEFLLQQELAEISVDPGSSCRQLCALAQQNRGEFLVEVESALLFADSSLEAYEEIYTEPKHWTVRARLVDRMMTTALHQRRKALSVLARFHDQPERWSQGMQLLEKADASLGQLRVWLGEAECR